MGRRRKDADLEITCTVAEPRTRKPKKEKFEKEKRFSIELKPITTNQELFVNSLKTNIISIAYGSAGSGKCQGEDVEVNLIVSDELYELLISM